MTKRIMRPARPLDIDPAIVDAANISSGNRCFIAQDAGIEAMLQRRFGRAGLCLKVFLRSEKTGNPDRFRWEGAILNESAKIQNLFARRGLAPRVYEIVILRDGRLAEVTDYVTGETPDPGELRRMLRAAAEEMNIGPVGTRWGGWHPNYVGGLLVDWGVKRFNDPEAYERDMVKRACAKSGTPYQPLGTLWDGPTRRNLPHRIEVMQLDEVDFAGKTVLDLGCNAGAFCRYAVDRGARRVVGVDRQLAQIAYEVANWLGYWNLDFLNLKMPGDVELVKARCGIGKFDIVFALAFVGHAGGCGEWLARCCKPGGLFFLEGHRGKQGKEQYAELLPAYFDRVEFVGHTDDMGHRPVFRCQK